MIDLVKLSLSAGDGGHGRVAFRREKYIPKGGPAGGNGGNGGQIVIRATQTKSSLSHLAGVKGYRASRGQNGGKQKRTGTKGEDVIIEVPVGTQGWLEAENKISHLRRERYGLDYLLGRDEVAIQKYYLAHEGQAIPKLPPDELSEVAPKQKLFELTQDQQTVIVCQGGFGGRGNDAFKGPAKTTPLEAEYGSTGEKKVIELEQLLLADVGLVGLPNAGKSTLISVLTSARPKIASYPFTTLEPALGTMQVPGDKPNHKQELVIADIPGLIAGASHGKGLGHDFLRHIKHCQLLLLVLFLPAELVFDQSLSDQDKALQLYQQLLQLRQELADYGSELGAKPYLVAINKQDLYSTSLVEAIKKVFAHHQQAVIMLSAATRENLTTLQGAVAELWQGAS